MTNNLPALSDHLTDVVPGGVSAEADIAEAVHDAWLVVEAIPERLELKKQVFGQLDELAPLTPSWPAIRRPMPAGCSWTRSTTPNGC